MPLGDPDIHEIGAGKTPCAASLPLYLAYRAGVGRRCWWRSRSTHGTERCLPGFGDRPCLSGNAIDGDRGATKDVVLCKGALSLNPHIVGHTGSMNSKSSVAAARKSCRRIRSRKGAHVDHW